MNEKHADFSGSIPAAYDRYLGPILFQPYAEDLAARLRMEEPGSVLELACGTGILTRVLRSKLAPGVQLIATDLNEPMFRHAATKFDTGEDVVWQQADAASLPFADEMFDAVVCQFGLMFVPDKSAAIREAYRVLKAGGIFLFNVWDAMPHNALARITHETILGYFKHDPPNFYETPFGYHDRAEIEQLLKEAGFREVATEVVPKISHARSADDVAKGFVHGNPVAIAIAERDPSLVPVITDAVAGAIGIRYGASDVHAPMRAIIARGRRQKR